VSEGETQAIGVLVPVFNEAACIAKLLEALTAMDFAEIIVADTASSDETLDVVATFPTVRVVRSARGRGCGINAAVAVAKSPLLIIVHADTALPLDTPALVRETLSSASIAGGCFRLAFDQSTPGLNLWAWFSRFETRFTTFGDQCFFMRRETFTAIGGVPDWPLLEDVALRSRLLRHGRFVKRPETVVTSARRFARRGVVRQQLINCCILLAYSCGAPIPWLARLYGRPVR
jgi:rSAM/selenodomain-associated transferase 2